MLENIFRLIEMGGPVMIPIILVCAWMWVLIIVKGRWFFCSNRRPLMDKSAFTCLHSGDLPQGYTGPKHSALYDFISRHRNQQGALGTDVNILLFEVCIRRQLKEVHRYLPTITLLATVAPLLGLLGTVSGMIETFRIIGMYGLGNSQAMAAGIREALITTQTGLLVAIPGLLAGHIMQKKAGTIHQDILIFHRAVNQWLEKEYTQCSD